ncbi:mitochondrial zinc maintenance protein 1 [Ceratobasidium sp. AG-Ba]|nr:mitochondrial zinc maintenance protein 1 [Ceratobasidium sp. AG-Ba]
MTTPITPALKSSARSAYRALFRASGTTFAGDDRVLYAFRDKVRTETIAGRQELDPAEYEARVQHAFEVATVLKKNLVQGTKEGDTYRLRITPDTELGSNEAVKVPYSRPSRGTPRPKCGEDPNAVAPLPPKSLRASLCSGAGSTRPYSTQASVPEPEPETEVEHNKARVQSLVSKLSQVNRRVSASMAGKSKEVVMERVLLEDKLGALAARIEFLAQSHTPVGGLQSAMDALLDVVWLNPDDVATIGKRSDPPVQMRQFVRYLHKAGKEATESRKAAMSLPSELRTAIGEEMETPAPGTKAPGVHTPADELRAILWRMLMVKRGMQRVAKVEGEIDNFGPLVGTVRRTLTHLTYAQDCLEDLERNGPRNEDLRAIIEELERVVDNPSSSPMFDMMRTVQVRIDQGTVWTLADKERDRSRSIRIGDDGIEHKSRPRYRQPYHYLRFLEEEQATPPPVGSFEHVTWRREQLARVHGAISKIRQKMDSMLVVLDELIVSFSEKNKYPDKAAPLQTAKDILTPEIILHVKETEGLHRNLARRGTVIEWANALGSIRAQTKLVETQLRTIDPITRGFFRSQPVDLLENKGARPLFIDLWLETILAFDCIWRVNRRLKQDQVAMFGIARDFRRRILKPGLAGEAGPKAEETSDEPTVASETRERDRDGNPPPSLRPSQFADESGVPDARGSTPLSRIMNTTLGHKMEPHEQPVDPRK